MAGRLSFAAGQSRCLCCCRLSAQYEYARHERRFWHIPYRPGSLALIVFSFLGFVSFGNIDCFVMYIDFKFSNCCLPDRLLHLIDSSSFRTLCTLYQTVSHVHVYLCSSLYRSLPRGEESLKPNTSYKHHESFLVAHRLLNASGYGYKHPYSNIERWRAVVQCHTFVFF